MHGHTRIGLFSVIGDQQNTIILLGIAFLEHQYIAQLEGYIASHTTLLFNAYKRKIHLLKTFNIDVKL